MIENQNHVCSLAGVAPGVKHAIIQLYEMAQQTLDRESYAPEYSPDYPDESWPEAYNALRVVSTQLGFYEEFDWPCWETDDEED